MLKINLFSSAGKRERGPLVNLFKSLKSLFYEHSLNDLYLMIKDYFDIYLDMNSLSVGIWECSTSHCDKKSNLASVSCDGNKNLRNDKRVSDEIKSLNTNVSRPTWFKLHKRTDQTLTNTLVR